MFIPVQMFTVECDNCKKLSSEDSEFSCWADESTALDEAICSEWIEENGKHYCPDCYYIGEDDEIVIKEIK